MNPARAYLVHHRISETGERPVEARRGRPARLDIVWEADMRPQPGAVACSWVLLGGVLSAQPAREIVMAPPELAHTGWLDDLRAAQLQTAGRFNVYNDFRFVDRIADSRITFQHRIVSDSGRTYKAVHYDHGYGLAVGDVDGGLARPVTAPRWPNGFGEPAAGRLRLDGSAGVGAANRIGVSASFADTITYIPIVRHHRSVETSCSRTLAAAGSRHLRGVRPLRWPFVERRLLRLRSRRTSRSFS
jgi:hypothetical protein